MLRFEFGQDRINRINNNWSQLAMAEADRQHHAHDGNQWGDPVLLLE